MIKRSLLFNVWAITLIASFFGTFFAIGGIFLYKIFFALNAILFLLFYGRQLYTQGIALNIHKQVRYLILYFFIWLGYACLSLIWANNQTDCIKYIGYIFISFNLVYFSVIHIRSKERWDSIVNLITVIVGSFCMIGVWEVITGIYLNGSQPEQFKAISVNIPMVVFKNPNDLATFLCLFFPFVLSLLEIRKNLIIKISVVIIIILSLFITVQTQSRANILCFIIGVGLFFLFSRNKLKLYFVIGLVLILSCISFFYPDILIEFSSGIYSQLESLNTYDSNSISIRKNLIYNGFAMLGDTYFIGVGAGNHPSNMIRYQELNDTWNIGQMHNFWMELLVDYGPIIFILFLLFYLSVLYKLFLIFKKAKTVYLKSTSKAVLSALIIFSLSVISSSSVIPGRHVWIFWGLVLAFINIHYKEITVVNST